MPPAADAGDEISTGQAIRRIACPVCEGKNKKGGAAEKGARPRRRKSKREPGKKQARTKPGGKEDQREGGISPKWRKAVRTPSRSQESVT